MNNISCSLGIDTSNYKTSVAIVSSEGEILCNSQKYLQVKKGERGLRQSDALFQHVMNLPGQLEEAFHSLPAAYAVNCIAVSTRPRPIEGSYMPVFNGGICVARSISAALNIPLVEVSHQEGHIEAVKYFSDMKALDRLICFHFSGGTTEALLVDKDMIEIAGGTKDISFGQVLDRIGVSLGMEFPCGEEMDNMKMVSVQEKNNLLPPIKVIDGYINLSGIETKAQRLIQEGTTDRDALVSMTFDRLGNAITDMCCQLHEKYEINDFLFAGGVSSSRRIRNRINRLQGMYNICFGSAELSTDNAVGVALLGGRKIWR
ncbi:MAG: O-sialoglycoprotein endopeptidase [Eubacteriaceae bacterium]|nr:O-sialoglycoprotein endopeptidase [Eubacteriaceae bacterium]